MKPDICTSLSGCEPNDYCRKCSHAYFEGEVFVNGRRHGFEFNPRHGVVFITLKGSPVKVQPKEDSPIWDEWQKWYDNKFNRD